MSSPNNNKNNKDDKKKDEGKRKRGSEIKQESSKKRNPGGFMNVRRNQPRVQKVNFTHTLPYSTHLLICD
jgi:hypothetical protein